MGAIFRNREVWATSALFLLIVGIAGFGGWAVGQSLPGTLARVASSADSISAHVGVSVETSLPNRGGADSTLIVAIKIDLAASPVSHDSPSTSLAAAVSNLLRRERSFPAGTDNQSLGKQWRAGGVAILLFGMAVLPIFLFRSYRYSFTASSDRMEFHKLANMAGSPPARIGSLFARIQESEAKARKLYFLSTGVLTCGFVILALVIPARLAKDTAAVLRGALTAAIPFHLYTWWSFLHCRTPALVDEFRFRTFLPALTTIYVPIVFGACLPYGHVLPILTHSLVLIFIWLTIASRRKIGEYPSFPEMAIWEENLQLPRGLRRVGTSLRWWFRPWYAPIVTASILIGLELRSTGSRVQTLAYLAYVLPAGVLLTFTMGAFEAFRTVLRARKGPEPYYGRTGLAFLEGGTSLGIVLSIPLFVLAYHLPNIPLASLLVAGVAILLLFVTWMRLFGRRSRKAAVQLTQGSEVRTIVSGLVVMILALVPFATIDFGATKANPHVESWLDSRAIDPLLRHYHVGTGMLFTPIAVLAFIRSFASRHRLNVPFSVLDLAESRTRVLALGASICASLAFLVTLAYLVVPEASGFSLRARNSVPVLLLISLVLLGFACFLDYAPPGSGAQTDASPSAPPPTGTAPGD